MLARISWLFSSPINPAPIARGPIIVGPPGSDPPTVGELVLDIPAADSATDASENVVLKTGADRIPSQYPINGRVVGGRPPPPPAIFLCGVPAINPMQV